MASTPNLDRPHHDSSLRGSINQIANTTQYTNGFGVDDIIQEESMDRSTPMGVVAYKTIMSAT